MMYAWVFFMVYDADAIQVLMGYEHSMGMFSV